MSIYKGTQLVSGNTKIEMAPVIGEIKVMLCSANYIPMGCLPCDGTEYNASQFQNLWDNFLNLSTPKLLTCTYADYNTSLTTYGQCAKIAVDTENNKFRVPLIKDGSFLQQALTAEELGKVYKAGLPNITGKFHVGWPGAAWGAMHDASGAFNTIDQQSNCSRNYYADNTRMTGANFDASRSSSIYGNSSTVQPEAVALRFFIVVADGIEGQAAVDWNNWNYELAKKADIDLSNTGRVTNCITEVPQDIKLELANGTLTLKAGSKVYIPNGFESDGTTPHFDTFTLTTDAQFSTVHTSAVPCYVTYNRGDNTLAFPAVTDTLYKYNPTTNKSAYNSTDNDWSLPICIAVRDTTGISKITTVFNGYGFFDKYGFILPGVKGLIPNGRDTDGSLKSMPIMTTNRPQILSVDANWATQDWFLQSNGVITWYPLKAGEVTYDKDRNYWVDTRKTADISYFVPFMRTMSDKSAVKFLFGELVTPMQVLDNSTPHIIETYKEGNTWYRLYSDGWVEQGGFLTARSSAAIILPIRMKDASYSIYLTVRQSSGYYSYWVVSQASGIPSSTSFTIQTNYSGDSGIDWEVKGWYNKASV